MPPARKKPANHESEGPGDRYSVPNLERALHILEYLASASGPCGITELSDALGLPKNSVFRITTTLAAHGYLVRDPATKNFSLGTKFLTLGYAAVREGSLVQRASDVMRRVCDETGESTSVGVLDGTEGVVLENFPSPHQVAVTIRVGTRFPIHTGAPAKAMLACMSVQARENLVAQLSLPRFTKNTLTSKKALLADIASAARCGYALDVGEHNEGIMCVGAAVLDRVGVPVGGLWITGPAFRLTADRLPAMGKIVTEGAKQVSQRYGHR